jgi:hypothetical protein
MTTIAWLLGPLGLGAIGYFIDFYLGKRGQEKVKDWLLKGWSAFDDMKWYNFSEKEAQYFVSLQDRVFGARLISWQRIRVVFAIECIFLSAFVVTIVLQPTPPRFLHVPVPPFLPTMWNQTTWGDFVTTPISMCALAVSISLSRLLSLKLIRASSGRMLGPLPYVALLLIHYGLLVLWRPIVVESIVFSGAFIEDSWNMATGDTFSQQTSSEEMRYMLSQAKKDLQVLPWTPAKLLEEARLFTVSGYVTDAVNVANAQNAKNAAANAQDPLPSVANDPVSWVMTMQSYPRYATVAAMSDFANALRILVALVLLASYLLRECVSRLLSTLWARVYESDKGAFTLILGGVGAVASLLRALLGHA